MGIPLPAALAAPMLLASCTLASNWHLMDSGYSIDADNGEGFAIEVHLNQLGQLGGEVHSAEFRHFVGERLQRHGLCAPGWEFLPCTEDGSCIQQTARSITVFGRCETP